MPMKAMKKGAMKVSPMRKVMKKTVKKMGMKRRRVKALVR